MPPNYAPSPDDLQASQVAHHLAQRLALYLAPLLSAADDQLDRRLVVTMLVSVAAIIMLRNSSRALLLSELGAYIASPQHAPAGTKRLAKLIHSNKWSASLIHAFLCCHADQRLLELEQAAQTAYLLWDESVIEKPESNKIAGLSPVRSSQAARLTRPRPGYYQPPKGKIIVAGIPWLMLLLVGAQGAPRLAAMRWWTTRGEHKTSGREVATKLLKDAAKRWGQRVIHIFDRGYAGAPWLAQLLAQDVRFIVRWNAHYRLLDAEGNLRQPWELARGKRSQYHREIWDSGHRCWRKAGLIFMPIQHPDYSAPLWLVVCRGVKAQPPWYLLTNCPVGDEQDAWKIVFGYVRRWQIEMGFRYCKSELGFESVRTWDEHSREKLLMLASLCYGYLLGLLADELAPLCDWLLRYGCPRTGRQRAALPLYRLREALMWLWQEWRWWRAVRPRADLPSAAAASSGRNAALVIEGEVVARRLQS